MSGKTGIFLILALVLQGVTALGQESLKYSKHHTISEGLAHNGVTCILEDSRGYMWFGTYDGLNRYDGYEFRTFKNTIDRHIFISNRIRSLAEDRNGIIWIGTDEGITIFNQGTGEFRTIYSNRFRGKGQIGPIVRKILFNDEGLAICATEDAGVLTFSSDYDFLNQYLPLAGSDTLNIRIDDGAVLGGSHFIFASPGGLLLLDLETDRFSRIEGTGINSSNTVIMLEGDQLLVTRPRGIAFLGIKEDEGAWTFTTEGTYLQDYELKCAAVDQLGNLWLGTMRDGVVHVSNIAGIRNGNSYTETSHTGDLGILRISCIEPSSSYGCWSGSFNNGLFRFDLEKNPFRTYHARNENGIVFGSDRGVTEIVPFDGNRVLLSTQWGGLALFNTDKDDFDPVPFRIRDREPERTWNALHDSKGDIWFSMGQMRGIYRLRNSSSAYRRIEAPNLPDYVNPARSWTEDRNGNIWIGGVRGVYKLNLDENREVLNVESLDDHPEIRQNPIPKVRYLYADPLHDFIWIGSDTDGLYRIRTSGDIPLSQTDIEHYVEGPGENSLPGVFVSVITRLPNGELWLGTEGGGICKVLDSDTEPRFIPFTEKDGLSNNVVKSILFDDENNLWIGTNIGLNKFDTRNFRFSRFGIKDGLPFEDFYYAAERLDNGTMVFSGVIGFLYFDPSKVLIQESLPRLALGELRLYNNPVMPGDTIRGRVLLDSCLSKTGEITLKYNENVFSIELAALHFSNPDNHFIKYRLLPVNEEWTEITSDQRHVSFNGLRPGEYTLNAMASNALDEWTDITSLRISITPPLWRTNLAIVIYFLLVAFLIAGGIYFMLKIQSLKHNLEIEQLEINNVKEMNAAKLRFFSNISHEIKTPLSLIKGPVLNMADRLRTQADSKEKFELVQRQIRKIYRLIDQVHDFQRADANRLRMDPTYFCFDEFIREVVSDFEYLAKNDKKILECKGNGSRIYVHADRDKLEKVINNLLNNSFKFTEENDTIAVEYSAEDDDLLISVTDTGRGIDPVDLPHVFERFYQAQERDSKHKGSGIGLAFSKRLVEMHYGYIGAESECGQGTTISIRLPVVKDMSEDPGLLTEEQILSREMEYDEEKAELEMADPGAVEYNDEFAGAHLFICEDNEDMRVYLSDSLEGHFSITSFSNGKDCIKAMQEEWPDIVISDVLMPELNGFDLCKRIKSDIKTSHIPVVLVTACTALEDQIQGIRMGADAYINKPFDLQHLVARTEALLQNRKQLRERFQLNLPLSFEKTQGNSYDNAFIEKLYNLMEKNLDNQDLDLNSFAKELYLNRSHFYQKVKALTNQTPFELLKSFRLNRAAELLVEKKLTVNEAYILTGFKSRSHFSKLFKERYNLTPGKYASEAIRELSGST